MCRSHGNSLVFGDRYGFERDVSPQLVVFLCLFYLLYFDCFVGVSIVRLGVTVSLFVLLSDCIVCLSYCLACICIGSTVCLYVLLFDCLYGFTVHLSVCLTCLSVCLPSAEWPV